MTETATAMLVWGRRGCEVTFEGLWTPAMVEAAKREMHKSLRLRHVEFLKTQAETERAKAPVEPQSAVEEAALLEGK